jgi:hypothetical protein
MSWWKKDELENPPTEKAGPLVKKEDSAGGALAPQGRMTIPDPGGVIGSRLTRFQADQQAKAFKSLAERTRAKADFVQAQGELADTYIDSTRRIARLEDLPDILALDRERRSHERQEERAEIAHREQLRPMQRADELAETAHQQALAKKRRERELLDGERATFNADLGLEKQRRLKDLDLKIWETRKNASGLDAEAEARKLREELEGSAGRSAAPHDPRAHAQAMLAEAIASGNEAEKDRWQAILDLLDRK